MKQNKSMIVIGLTGGIGGGKSQVTAIMREKYNAFVIDTDSLGHEVMEPGTEGYQRIVEHFGTEILNDGRTEAGGDGAEESETAGDQTEKTSAGNSRETENFREGDGAEKAETDSDQAAGMSARPIDRKKLAALVFPDAEELRFLNGVIHPAVIRRVKEMIAAERAQGTRRYVVLETALLFESGLIDCCDRAWYVYASEDVRRKRLMESRGYSEERVQAVFRQQKREEDFRAEISRREMAEVIDNSGTLADTEAQIEKLLTLPM